MQQLMTSKIKKFAALTRLEQTLFALPFVLIGGLLPFFDIQFLNRLSSATWISWIFVLPAFLAARISGMSLNQYLDRDIDALNPRTLNRPLPKGLVTPKSALRIAYLFLGLFLIFTWCIHFLVFTISCIAAALIILYSYMKRIHYTCHFVLGWIHFLGPFCAYVAVKHQIDLPIIFLSFATFFLHSGNDILYALQDMNFDCFHKLHSIPSRFGLTKSLKIAFCLQTFSVISLILFGVTSNFFWGYYGAPCITIVSFYLFHKRRKNPNIFFLTQTTVGAATLFFTMWACLCRVL